MQRCLCDDDDATIDDDDAMIDDDNATINDGDATIDDGDNPGGATRLQQRRLSAEQNNHHEAHFVLIHPSSQSMTSTPSGSLEVK